MNLQSYPKSDLPHNISCAKYAEKKIYIFIFQLLTLASIHIYSEELMLHIANWIYGKIKLGIKLKAYGNSIKRWHYWQDGTLVRGVVSLSRLLLVS